MSSSTSIDSNDSIVPGTPILSPSGRLKYCFQSPKPVPTYVFHTSATIFRSDEMHPRVVESSVQSRRITESNKQSIKCDEVLNLFETSIGSEKIIFNQIRNIKKNVTHHFQESDYSEMNNSFKPSHIPPQEPGGWIRTRRTDECSPSVIKAVSVAVKKERLREKKEKRSRRNSI